MIVWSIVLKAPLEEPANPGAAPNPAKAPWYFLGLQEMLVYFDPWMAGVVLPTLIIVGLMAIPYIDTNPRGNGYFTFRERKWEIIMFCFGFLILWVLLIILGTFLRGPELELLRPVRVLGPEQARPAEQRERLGDLLGQVAQDGAPDVLAQARDARASSSSSSTWARCPGSSSKTLFRRFYEKMGMVRYFVGVNLFLIMLAVPIKMYLRWIFNLKYIVNIQEFSFNI